MGLGNTARNQERIIQYADDIVIFIQDNYLKQVIQSCKNYMIQLEEWIRKNYMELSHNKTKIIHFERRDTGIMTENITFEGNN